MKLKELKTTLFADYYQFYLQDELVDGNLSDSWTPAAGSRLLALAHGTIGVGTVRNLDVPVTISIFDSEPEFPSDLNCFDQINECDLQTESGKIVVAGCTDYFPDAQRIEVEKGLYRIRVYYGNLNSISEDELEGDDFYELQLWPVHTQSELKVIKGKS